MENWEKGPLQIVLLFCGWWQAGGGWSCSLLAAQTTAHILNPPGKQPPKNGSGIKKKEGNRALAVSCPHQRVALMAYFWPCQEYTKSRPKARKSI